MVSVMSRRPVVLNTDDLDRRSTMPFDVAATRAQFPSLASGIAHFDGPGGTQAPAVVGAAIARTLTGPLFQERFKSTCVSTSFPLLTSVS